MAYLLVGIGGFFGSITRVKLGEIIKSRSSTIFPLGTFIINITGAILLGIVAIKGKGQIYSLIGDGFLGGYTTFSTFMFESFNLFKDNKKLNAALYIILSVVLGIIGFIVGTEIGKI